MAAFCVLFSQPVFAQDGPAFDYAKVGRAAEKFICADAALAVLDRRLVDRFAAALKIIKGLDGGGEEAEVDLRAFQRDWVTDRDDCWKATDLRACVEQSYLTREGELVAKRMLKTPTGTVFWTCDGNPANDVVTFFFDAELPSVRI